MALVSGVGVDLARFRGPVDRAAVRAGLGIGPEDAVLITVGEHSERKNHETVIAAAAPIEGAHVLFCGVGDRQAALEKQARELDMEGRVHFLGFRKDIPALLAASDVFVFPSLQEGLPVAQMEAMAVSCTGLTACRGGEQVELTVSGEQLPRFLAVCLGEWDRVSRQEVG